MTQSEAGKGPGSRESQYAGKPKENFDEGYEIIFGGWHIMTEDPPGQRHETRTMRGKLWWRPTNGDTWRCRCGDLVPKDYEVCPICKTFTNVQLKATREEK